MSISITSFSFDQWMKFLPKGKVSNVAVGIQQAFLIPDFDNQLPEDSSPRITPSRLDDLETFEIIDHTFKTVLKSWLECAEKNKRAVYDIHNGRRYLVLPSKQVLILYNQKKKLDLKNSGSTKDCSMAKDIWTNFRYASLSMPYRSSDRLQRERLQEIRCARDFNKEKGFVPTHCVIAYLHKQGHHKGKFKLRMFQKWCCWGTLENFDRFAKIYQKPLVKIQLAIQILQSMVTLEKRGLLHRDLGLRNIYVNSYTDSKGEVFEAFIGDLATSCAADAKEREALVTTGWFTAPELALKFISIWKEQFDKVDPSDDKQLAINKKHNFINVTSFKSDMFAIGVIFYALIACNNPPWFKSQNASSYVVLAQYQGPDTLKWAAIPSDWKKLISNLLDIDSSKRFSAKEALQFITTSKEDYSSFLQEDFVPMDTSPDVSVL